MTACLTPQHWNRYNRQCVKCIKEVKESKILTVDELQDWLSGRFELGLNPKRLQEDMLVA